MNCFAWRVFVFLRPYSYIEGRRKTIVKVHSNLSFIVMYNVVVDFIWEQENKKKNTSKEEEEVVGVRRRQKLCLHQIIGFEISAAIQLKKERGVKSWFMCFGNFYHSFPPLHF
jgi:hypothetical protein